MHASAPRRIQGATADYASVFFLPPRAAPCAGPWMSCRSTLRPTWRRARATSSTTLMALGVSASAAGIVLLPPPPTSPPLSSLPCPSRHKLQEGPAAAYPHEPNSTSLTPPGAQSRRGPTTAPSAARACSKWIITVRGSPRFVFFFHFARDGLDMGGGLLK